MKRLRSIGVLPSLLLLCTACVVGPRGQVEVLAPVPAVRVTYVEREPPPVRHERIPEPPSRDHHWVAGHWSWDGREYIWVPGYYHVRPRPNLAWVDGHWERHERGWYWVEGHWR
jgi:hypothetical protein